MSIQEKFEKAVNVIRNLPKNGSYQPSHELQLRFYGYYKQATEGFNHQPKPNFWEVVKRAKWDAWSKLGNMTKEEAMIHYVEELRKIVETMSYTDNVANFLNSLDNFYEHVPAEDLEMLVGPIIEKIRSRPNSPLSGSPLASRDTSPSRAEAMSRDTSPIRLSGSTSTKHITSSLETSPASSYSASPLPPDTDDDDDDEHFLDTQTEPDRAKDSSKKILRGEDQLKQHLLSPISTSPYQGKRSMTDIPNGDVTLHVPEVQITISTLKKDIDQIKGRLNNVENSVTSKTNLLSSTGAISQSHALSSSPSGTSAAATDAFKKAINDMTKEMENLHRRIATIETRRQQEMAVGRKRGGSAAARWWGIPLQTTTILLAWPVLLLLISRWLSKQRRH